MGQKTCQLKLVAWNRTGKKVLLRVTPRDVTAEPVENDVTVSSMMYSQPTPLHVYVGGVADNEPVSLRCLMCLARRPSVTPSHSLPLHFRENFLQLSSPQSERCVVAVGQQKMPKVLLCI